MKSNEVFDILVDIFINTGELGHYNKNDWSIMLYDIENTPHHINYIKKRIDKLTTKYKIVVLDPKKKYTNVNILDIEL